MKKKVLTLSATLIGIVIITLLMIWGGETQKKEETSDVPENQADTFALDGQHGSGFVLKQIEPCSDALTDSLYHRSVIYTESKEWTDKQVIVRFKFKDACCQKFRASYRIANDTVAFDLMQSNDEVCSCICWYKYELKLELSESVPNHIVLNKI